MDQGELIKARCEMIRLDGYFLEVNSSHLPQTRHLTVMTNAFWNLDIY